MFGTCLTEIRIPKTTKNPSSVSFVRRARKRVSSKPINWYEVRSFSKKWDGFRRMGSVDCDWKAEHNKRKDEEDWVSYSFSLYPLSLLGGVNFWGRKCGIHCDRRAATARTERGARDIFHALPALEIYTSEYMWSTNSHYRGNQYPATACTGPPSAFSSKQREIAGT